MKYKDYVRLSKISLKSRKKTTRTTVRGISFGLILLMPLLFIVIAFHIDLNKEVNKDASIRVFNVEFSDATIEDTYVYTILEDNSDEVFNIDGLDNVIKYNQYTFNNRRTYWDSSLEEEIEASRFTVMLDGKIFTLDKNISSTDTYGHKRDGTVGIQIIDTSQGNSIFLKSDSEILGNKNPLIAGTTFSSDNSAKEVLVSSNFLKHYNLTEEIINKTITINYQLQNNDGITTSKTSITGSFSNYQNVPVTIFKEYKIVGIYDSNIYNSSVRKNAALGVHSNDDTISDTYFWLTSDSVYTSTGHSYIPQIMLFEEDYGNGDTYLKNAYYYDIDLIDMAQSAIANNCVFIPGGMGVTSPHSANYTPKYAALLEFSSYKDANNAVSIIEDLYSDTSTSSDDITVTSYYMNDTFRNYRMFYNVFTYASIVLAIFGGIVFFATLLNLYNTIHYSVQSRRNYLGLSRAIGMKNNEVIKLYFIEIFQIFKRSYIWTAIFGGGICIGVCALFKMIMNSSVGAIITIDLSLNPIFILAAFLILAIINTIISVVFSLVACNNVANKPILEVLVENR